ncbi:unnamed protein product [marine sediment metagenome]|uniref:Uncharacterized protein n=1 Tax=marine sediment metagenome TaxID=412755 RepID=X1G0V0_9ZZZZ
MNIPEAIKILQHKVDQNVFQVDPDAFTALINDINGVLLATA